MKNNFIYFISILLLTLISACQKEVFTGYPDEPLPTNGKVFIQSKPYNAKIYSHGKNMGLLTPDTLSWLDNGMQTITLKMDLFKDTSFQVLIDLNNKANIYIDYYTNPGHYGKIDCDADTYGADIIINGINTGKKTRSLLSPYFPGYYNVKLTMKEHRADSTILPVHGGQSNYVYFELEDTSKYVSYKISNSKIPNNNLLSIVSDHNNIKWIAADSGLISFNGSEWKFYNDKNSILPNTGFFKLLVDKQNNLWIATLKGLYVRKGNTFINYSDKLPSNVASSIACDENGVIWISTGEGLVKYDGSVWKTFNTTNSGIYGNILSCVATVKNGKVWYAGNRIGSYDGVRWVTWDLDNMQIDPAIGMGISDLKVDKNEFVYVSHLTNIKRGIRGGLTCYDGSSWSEIKIPNFYKIDIFSIDVDANNNKWIGAQTGLAKFQQLSDLNVFHNLSKQVPVNGVRGMTIDNNGDLWYVTFGNGLAKIKKGNY